MAPPAVTRHTFAAVAPAEERKALSILLAEDNPVNQQFAVRPLEKQGHAVQVAPDGHEAVAAVAAGAFDLVLMDVQMPGMSGLEAAVAIRERERTTGGRVPIVAMTARALNADRDACLAAGMDGYIAKPVSPKVLAEAIARAMPAGLS